MALSATGIGQDQYPTTVEDYRNLITALLPGSGAIGLGEFTLAPFPQDIGLAVEVGPGRVVLEGRAATGQGSYFAWSSEPEVLQWPAPSAQPRVDALVLTVADAQYGTVEVQGPAWLVVQGVASTTPVPPSTAEIEAAAPAGAWVRVADVGVSPGATVIDPATISRRLLPAGGGWRPLTLATGLVARPGLLPSYRVDQSRVWLTGAVARQDGSDFAEGQLFGNAVLARVGEEVRPLRTCYGVVTSTARLSQDNPVTGGGLLRAELQPTGQIYVHRFNRDYTCSWIDFSGFTYWLDY
ncbi:hypothetical protein AB0M72_03685 [Nocardiopsis dassonvillei]